MCERSDRWEEGCRRRWGDDGTQTGEEVGGEHTKIQGKKNKVGRRPRWSGIERSREGERERERQDKFSRLGDNERLHLAVSLVFLYPLSR